MSLPAFIPVIKPKFGLNELSFGSSMEECEKHLGKPEESSPLETETNDPTLVWHYWEKGLSLFFDHSQTPFFSCAEIDNPETLLWNVKVFNLNEEEIKELMRSMAFFKIDIEVHEWGEKRISFDDALMDFYFEEGKLKCINYNAEFDTSNNNILILPN